MDFPDAPRTPVGTIFTRSEGGKWFGSFSWEGDGEGFEVKVGSDDQESAIGQVLDKLKRGLAFSAWCNAYCAAAVDLTAGRCDMETLSEDAQAAYLRDPKRPPEAAALADYDPFEPVQALKAEEEHAARYVVHGVRYEGDRLVAVQVHQVDDNAPDAFFYDAGEMATADMVDFIKAGGRVDGLWQRGELGIPWPLEVVIMADGTLSIKAQGNGGPGKFMISTLQR